MTYLTEQRVRRDSLFFLLSPCKCIFQHRSRSRSWSRGRMHRSADPTIQYVDLRYRTVCEATGARKYTRIVSVISVSIRNCLRLVLNSWVSQHRQLVQRYWQTLKRTNFTFSMNLDYKNMIKITFCKLSSLFILKTFISSTLGSDVLPYIWVIIWVLSTYPWTPHSECKPSSSISFFTYYLQVFLPLPTHLTPATTTFLQADIQSSPFLCSTCPNHLNPSRLTTSATLSTPQITVQIHTALPIRQQHPAHPSHHHPFRPLQT